MSAAPEIEAVRSVGPLLVIGDFARRLGIQETIDRICPSRSNALLTHGQVALAIIANRLCQPLAMVHLIRWASQSAAGFLLGFDGTLLNDDRIARCLDALAPHLDELQGELMVKAIQEFNLDLRRLHWDLTSIVLQGEYPSDEGSGTYARADYGYGGVDGCKQLRVGELLTADGGVPLQQLRQDGNRADVGTVLTALTSVTQYISLPDCLVVGDSKLLSAAIIGKLRKQKFSFLAPVARTDEVRDAYTGLDPAAWVRLEYLPRRQEHLPEKKRTIYRGQETEFLFRDPENKEEVHLRRLFVLNETERELRGGARLRAIERYCEKITQLMAKVGQRGATTRLQVERSLGRLRKEHPLAEPFVKVRIRAEDGTPYVYWDVDETAVKEAALLDGVTVLLTNYPKEEADAHELLRLWKGQLESERRFSDWKGPLKVRPVFLTSQERINVLLMLCHLALMIFCLVERAARQGLEKEGTKKIARLYAAQHDAIPTGRLIFQAFEYLQMVELRVGDEVFRRLPPLTLVQERLLSLLGVRKPP